MNEKITDILNQIKGRFSNPLFFSFICSWIVLNWEIVVSLIWYDTDQIIKPHKTIFEFISSKINCWESLYFPFILALIYTFSSPIVKNIIKAFYAWTSNWGENWILRISKGGKVPIEKYFSLKDNYKNRTEILEKVIKEESESNKLFESINTELLKSKKQNNTLQSELNITNDIISNLNDSRILDGNWIFKCQGRNNTIEEEILISDNRIYVIKSYDKQEHLYDIQNFYYNKGNSKIFFIKKEANTYSNPQRTLITNLKLNTNGHLVGDENGSKVEYRKPKK